jgi:RND family efflux transporter MFP subunit
MDASEKPPGADERGARARRRLVWWVVGTLTTASLALSGMVLFGDGGGASPAAAKAERAAPAVRVAAATREDITLTVVHRGELDSDVAELAAQSAGYIVDLSVNIGDRVEKDQVLAIVDPAQAERQLAEAAAAVMGAKAAKQRATASLAAAKVELERGERLAQKDLLSEKDATALQNELDVQTSELAAAEAELSEAHARVAAMGEMLRSTKLTAPFDGAVAERYVDAGSIVRPGTVVLRLVRSGALRVRFRVPERDIAKLKPGLAFEVTTQASGARRFQGTLSRIAAEVSRLDRTIAVEGLLNEEVEILKPGMYAEVRLSFGELEGAVVVPSAGVIERVELDGSTQSGVFVVRDGKVAWTPIEVAGVSGDRTAVEPLDEGASIVVLGHEQLRDGSSVRVTEAENRDDAPQGKP